MRLNCQRITTDGLNGQDSRHDYDRRVDGRSCLDTNAYPPGRKISDAELATIRLERADFHGEWNYTIHPRTADTSEVIL